MFTANKVLLWNCHIDCIERGLFGKHFKVLGRKIVLCVYIVSLLLKLVL